MFRFSFLIIYFFWSQPIIKSKNISEDSQPAVVFFGPYIGVVWPPHSSKPDRNLAHMEFKVSQVECFTKTYNIFCLYISMFGKYLKFSCKFETVCLCVSAQVDGNGCTSGYTSFKRQ